MAGSIVRGEKKPRDETQAAWGGRYKKADV